MGNSSYFRFDDDNKTQYIYSLNHHVGVPIWVIIYLPVPFIVISKTVITEINLKNIVSSSDAGGGMFGLLGVNAMPTDALATQGYLPISKYSVVRIR